MDLGVPGTALLPGAAEALDAVRSQELDVIVITAKFEPNARRCLDHVGLSVDAVFGWRYGPAKAETLIEQGALAYVGDTEADMNAARVAGIPGLGVTTGPHDAAELHRRGRRRHGRLAGGVPGLVGGASPRTVTRIRMLARFVLRARSMFSALVPMGRRRTAARGTAAFRRPATGPRPSRARAIRPR